MKINKLMKMVVVRAAAVVLSLAAAIFLMEVGLRVFEPDRLAESRREKDLFCRFDPELGWSPLPNVTAIHSKDGHSGLVHQNRFGFRGPDNMETKNPSGRKRVLVLGDSYVWGFGVGQDDLFSDPRVCGTNVEVLNFGVSGYGTDQELLLYQREGTKFTVDEVVLAFTPYNDVENNLNSKQYGYLKPFFTMESDRLVLHTQHIRNDWSRVIANAIRRHSRVWNRLGTFRQTAQLAAQRHEASKGTAQASQREYTESAVTERDRQGVELTVALIKRLKEAVAAQNAEFSVIFIPYKPHIESRIASNHPLAPLLAQGLERAGINYKEPYPQYLQAAISGVHPFNNPDNHFSPEGHAMFARFLLETHATRYHARLKRRLARRRMGNDDEMDLPSHDGG